MAKLTEVCALSFPSFAMVELQRSSQSETNSRYPKRQSWSVRGLEYLSFNRTCFRGVFMLKIFQILLIRSTKFEVSFLNFERKSFEL